MMQVNQFGLSMMNKKSLLFLVVGGTLLTFALLVRANDRPEFEFEYKGHHAKSIGFQAGKFEKSEKAKAFDVKLFGEFQQLISDLARETLVNQGYTLVVGAKYLPRLLGIVTRTKDELDKLEEADPTARQPKEFLPHMVRMLKLMMANSKSQNAESDHPKDKRSRQEKKEDALKFVAELDELLETINLILVNSPVGFELDWERTTIDGKNMAEFGPYYINYFRNNGYGSCIMLLDKLISVLNGLVKKKQAANAA